MTELGTDIFTLTHTILSLLAVLSGFPLLAAMLKGRDSPWRTSFLALNVLTSVTGVVFFPIQAATPALVFAGLALTALAVAIYAYYGQHLSSCWWCSFS